MSNSQSNIWCNLDAQNCVSGCCDVLGECATTIINCHYQYYDYVYNIGYYFPDDATQSAKAISNSGPVVAGIVTGVTALAIVIGAIIWWKRRVQMFAEALTVHNETSGSTTNIMANSTSQYPNQQNYEQKKSYLGHLIKPNPIKDNLILFNFFLNQSMSDNPSNNHHLITLFNQVHL